MSLCPICYLVGAEVLCLHACTDLVSWQLTYSLKTTRLHRVPRERILCGLFLLSDILSLSHSLIHTHKLRSFPIRMHSNVATHAVISCNICSVMFSVADSPSPTPMTLHPQILLKKNPCVEEWIPFSVNSAPTTRQNSQHYCASDVCPL